MSKRSRKRRDVAVALPEDAGQVARRLLDALHGSDEDLTPEEAKLVEQVRADHQRPPAEGYEAWAEEAFRKVRPRPAARLRATYRTRLSKPEGWNNCSFAQ
jgi:hypothetical protein